MSEQKSQYLLQGSSEPVSIERETRLSTRNLDELMAELADLERRATPFVNKLRALQGKQPLVAPKG